MFLYRIVIGPNGEMGCVELRSGLGPAEIGNLACPVIRVIEWPPTRAWQNRKTEISESL
jgi:hypothetical protein